MKKIPFILVALSFVIAVISPISAYAKESTCGAFINLSSSSPVCEAALYARNRGIFIGNYPEFSSSPNINYNSLWRAEVLPYIFKAFGSPDLVEPYWQQHQEFPAGKELGFSDIPPQSRDWWHVWLKKAKELGIVSGDQQGRFRPTDQATKAEFLKMFLYLSPHRSEILQWDLNSKPNVWTDVYSNDWYAKILAYANYHHLFDNFDLCGNNQICPNTAIKQSEIALLIYNYQKNLGEEMGYPELGVIANYYSALNNKKFTNPSLPGNFKEVYKLPSRVFDLVDQQKTAKYLDCSEPTSNYQVEWQESKTGKTIKYPVEADPWIIFYAANSSWATAGRVDFYLAYPKGINYTSEKMLIGPFNDHLSSLIQDIISTRCIVKTAPKL